MPVSSEGSGRGKRATAEGIRMAAAVLARAAMSDRGDVPGRQQGLEALAEHLAKLAHEIDDSPRPSNPPEWARA
jgi:hypothetical protein